MKIRSFGWGALVGTLLTAPLIAILYAADELAGLPFVPFDLFDWVARVLPGPLVTFGIDGMIETLRFLGVDVASNAKTAEQALAIIQFAGIGIVAAALFFVVMRAQERRPGRGEGLILGLLVGLPMMGISLAVTRSDMLPIVSLVWIVALFIGWGLLVSWAYRHVVAAPQQEVRAVEPLGRRRFLVRLGASAAVLTVAGTGIGAGLATRERRRAEELAEAAHDDSDAPEGQSFPNANDPVTPVPGTRPEYTPIKDHYKVFINTEPTYIQEADWVLPVVGLVENPLMLTLDDFKNNYERRDQYVTIRCISGRIDTNLIGTTLWTGVSVQDVLADAGVSSDARYLHITCGDGYYETVDLDLIDNDERIMLCYEWDGNDLPKDHGFPLRIWIPDVYGMKQPKWITGIEVSDEYTPGYWVERNWDRDAIVKATSVIDTVAVDALIENGSQRLVPIGGIAYSGDRGVSRVEVQVDDGPWEEAQLRAPLSGTTWVIWRYEWPFEEGEHTFTVRMFEGDGTPQIAEFSSQRPDGVTGLHTVEEEIG